MYCRFCGENIDDRSAFCSACGKPTGPAAPIKPAVTIAAPSSAQVGVILCYVLGALFLLGGILPYLLAGNATEYNETLISLILPLGTNYTSANSLLSGFVSRYASLFYFVSSFLTFFAGLLLLKRSTTAKNALLVCIIFHVLSLACSGIVFGLVDTVPDFVLSVTPDESVIDAALELLENEPLFLSYYREVAICRTIFSVVLILMAVAFLLVSKPQSQDIFKQTVKIPTAGITTMVVVLNILNLVAPVMQKLLVRRFGGSTALAGWSTANYYFSPVTTACLYATFLALGISVLLNRVNRWIITLPVVGLITIIGTALLLLTRAYLQSQNVLEEYFAMANTFCKGMVIGRTAMMIAIFLWFNAVARDKMPTWLQILLPPVLLIPYGFVETFGYIALHSEFFLPLGSFCIAFPLAVVSLLARRKKVLPTAETSSCDQNA